ncbi:hypothetical protein K474DRAFT_630732 [Panus rudis PR-1116 ss-1]|nr:hypothetical protein K474DRAFT_630732 [Panus rudis PR-1116 ss-1]
MSIRRFLRKRHPGPSTDYFLPDLSAGQRTPWNKALAVVFTNHFLSSELQWDGIRDPKIISDAFLVHLKTVKRHYEEQNGFGPSQRQLDTKKNTARRNRRRALLKCRCNGCLAHEDLIQYHDVIKACDLDAMSGDEEEARNGKVRHVVTRLSWRSADFNKRQS